MTEPLTSRQAEILDFIRSSIQDRGIPPTIREMLAEFGIRSLNGMRCHLVALKRKRRIQWTPGASRSIRLVSQDGKCPHCGAVIGEKE
jgi:repressor LexA